MSSTKTTTTTTSGIRVRKFGGPEVLELDDNIQLPPLGDKQVWGVEEIELHLVSLVTIVR